MSHYPTTECPQAQVDDDTCYACLISNEECPKFWAILAAINKARTLCFVALTVAAQHNALEAAGYVQEAFKDLEKEILGGKDERN